MKKISVMGFDSGYDYVKAVIGPNKKERISFPSAYVLDSNIRGRMATSFGSESDFGIDNITITFEEEKYYIGENVRDVDIEAHGDKEIADDKYSYPYEKAKLLAAAALFFPDHDEIVIENLVLGLAMKLYDDHQEKYKNNYENEVFEFKAGKDRKKVEIKNVVIIPQSLGAYYNDNLDAEGNSKEYKDGDELYGVLDIGGRTLDGTVARRSKRIERHQLGLDLGVILGAYEHVATKTGIPVNIIQNAYLSGKQRITYENKQHNIAAMCKAEFDNLAREIHSKVTRQWRTILPTLEKIYLTGGGAEEVYDFIQDYFDTPLALSGNPRYDNALGFYKIGNYFKATKEEENSSTKE